MNKFGIVVGALIAATMLSNPADAQRQGGQGRQQDQTRPTDQDRTTDRDRRMDRDMDKARDKDRDQTRQQDRNRIYASDLMTDQERAEHQNQLRQL